MIEDDGDISDAIFTALILPEFNFAKKYGFCDNMSTRNILVRKKLNKNFLTSENFKSSQPKYFISLLELTWYLAFPMFPPALLSQDY